MSSSPSEEFLDKLAAQVLENPSKEFLKFVPESVRLTLQMPKEKQEAFNQDCATDRIPKRVRLAGETFYLRN